MNDLYNAQNVILLAEIIESRFQLMHERYGFNPRRYDSASTLSCCIEREMNRVMLYLLYQLSLNMLKYWNNQLQVVLVRLILNWHSKLKFYYQI